MPGRTFKDRIRRLFHSCEDNLVPAGETSRTYYYSCKICGKRFPMTRSGRFMPDELGKTNGRI